MVRGVARLNDLICSDLTQRCLLKTAASDVQAGE